MVTPFRSRARELLRETLLDAARQTLGERAWSEVVMDDIALAAGVSRGTLYKHFVSRRAFGRAIAAHEMRSALAEVERVLRASPDDPERTIADAFDVLLSAGAQAPLLRQIVTPQPAGGAAAELLDTDGLFVEARTELCLALVDVWPRLSQSDAGLVSESVLRLALSCAATPTAPSKLNGRRVASLLAPFLARATPPGARRKGGWLREHSPAADSDARAQTSK